jgi:uncharacterized membrane protein YphA (DoxX/SURF4 family)
MMRLRDSIGLNLSPIVLRLVLGVVFLQAGAAKFFTDSVYTPQQTAALAQMGVAIPGQPRVVPPVVTDPPAEADPPDADAAEGDVDVPAEAEAAVVTDEALYPDGATLRSVYHIALIIDSAAHPGFDGDGNQLEPFWPAEAAKGKWPVWLALAAGATELVAGILMFAGFFTRIGAFSLVCVMATAMWLTQIGPAIQAGGARLGFLPTHDLLDGMGWQIFLVQFTLLGVALALVLLGAGALSIDAIIFGAPGEQAHRKPRGDGDE